NPTPEIEPSQPQLEQLQDSTPVVIQVPAEKTPNLPIDELAKYASQIDNKWFADMQKIIEKDGTVWQADFKPNVRDIPYFPNNIGTYKQVYHRGVIRVLLLKNDIDGHLTKTAVEIEDKIVKFIKGGSG
ncbi:7240_t:CDS:2, partial [Rhizophagus irregularis]